MTGRDAKIFMEVLLDVLKREADSENYYNQKLEAMAPDDQSDKANDYRKWGRMARQRYEVTAKVLNAFEMQHFDVRL